MIRPRGAFGLDVEACHVGSQEGCFWRTITVETHVVETVRLAGLEEFKPRLQIHRGIARIGEVAVLHRTTQDGLSSVHVEHLATYFHLAHAENRFLRERAAVFGLHHSLQFVQLRIELIPEQHTVTHLQDNVTGHNHPIGKCDLHGLALHHVLLIRVEGCRFQRDGRLLKGLAVK